jgi:LCP family protein required for cell wall assembly
VYAYKQIASVTDTNVQIVEKPPTAIQTPIPEPEKLEIIEGIPEDIEEDYEIEAPEQVEFKHIYKQPAITETVTNILVVGTDVKGDISRGRSDCMLLLTYNRDKQEAFLTSFMRDIWINIPDYGWNRLNAAYAFGGIGLLINTVNDNFGLDIQNYVLIDFDGLMAIVDTLGGVEVTLTEKEAQHILKYCGTSLTVLSEEKNIYLLNGAQTLCHCRNRKSSGGDFDRTQRQRDVMLSLFKRMKVEKTIPKLTSVLSSLITNVKTNMPLRLMVDLGLEVIRSESLDLKQLRIPFDDTWNYANKDGRSVVQIDINDNKDQLLNVIY